MGSANGYFELVFETSVDLASRLEWIASMEHLYRTCLRDEALRDVCYMWWELVLAYGPPGDGDTKDDPIVFDAIFTLLASVLTMTDTFSLESALHGLGHLVALSPEKAVEVIDEFLRRRNDIPSDIRQYALACRTGNVL